MSTENPLSIKNVWTISDLDNMGWHDSYLHAIAWKGESDWAKTLLMDIDYIFAWVDPEPPAQSFTFWVSPCTLMFHQVCDMEVEIKHLFTGDTVIDEIVNSPNVSDNAQLSSGELTRWNVKLHEGCITFNSTGFTQFVRKQPVHTNSQELTQEQRGGFSFDFPESL